LRRAALFVLPLPVICVEAGATDQAALRPRTPATNLVQYGIPRAGGKLI
jgi:hypothetical protein